MQTFESEYFENLIQKYLVQCHFHICITPVNMAKAVKDWAVGRLHVFLTFEG